MAATGTAPTCETAVLNEKYEDKKMKKIQIETDYQRLKYFGHYWRSYINLDKLIN